jgi:hypothetical protein
MHKIKENFISFPNVFLKNKKCVNWSNNKVKTKNFNSIEIGIFCNLIFVNMEFLWHSL